MDNCSENSSFYIYTMNSDNWNTRFYQYLKDNLDKVGSSEREIGRLIRPSAICERNSKSMHNFYEAPNALTTSQSWWPCIFQQFIFFRYVYTHTSNHACIHLSIHYVILLWKILHMMNNYSRMLSMYHHNMHHDVVVAKATYRYIWKRRM